MIDKKNLTFVDLTAYYLKTTNTVLETYVSQSKKYSELLKLVTVIAESDQSKSYQFISEVTFNEVQNLNADILSEANKLLEEAPLYVAALDNQIKSIEYFITQLSTTDFLANPEMYTGFERKFEKFMDMLQQKLDLLQKSGESEKSDIE
jgi:translation elongation factor P/translation initiation factor 5A